jgi:hypothetical protein
MRLTSRNAFRAVFATILLVTSATVVAGYTDTSLGGPGSSTPSEATPAERTPAMPMTAAPENETETSPEPTPTATPTVGQSGPIDLESKINRTNVSESTTATGPLTVVATQGFYVSDENAELVAFDGDGTVVYHDDRYRVYFDVDPVPGTRHTVEYVAAKHLSASECSGSGRCTRNVVRQVNLSTGEESLVYGKRTPRIYSARWHDVDRLNDTHLVVADIVNDGVYVVDTRDDQVAWRWNASTAYSRDAGGKSGDWTHINDVEVLSDGRVMVSVRNMDQVVFLAPTAGPDGGWGVQSNWSLGSDDRRSVLFEQHNPDYIPADRGGPAVLVADSENGRVVEYERTGGTWNRTWGWTDARLQWPRDADRLPSGNTLVVDSHGDRVLEVRPDGQVVWSVTVGMPYDAERLGTGDESAGGQSISAIRERADETDDSNGPGYVDEFFADFGTSTTTREDAIVRPDTGPAAGFWLALKSAAPGHVVNGLLYVSPSGTRFSDLVFAAVFLATGLVWAGAELRWSQRRPLAALRRALTRLRG